MFHFLSAEALYGLLLVTTFASVGLLGLWAATSRWHPFLRTAIVLAILSVLLLRPMFEPFVMLVSQVATIAAGVAVYRKWKNRKQTTATDAQKTRYQFSLQTLLFVSTLVALGMAVGAKAPGLGWRIWLGYVVIGVTAGLGTLCAALAASSMARWWMRLIGFLGAVAYCLIALGTLLYVYENYSDPYHRVGVSSLVLMLVFVSLQLLVQLVVINFWQRATIRKINSSTEIYQHALRSVAFVLFLFAFLLPTYFVWRLLNPLPLPPHNPMSPNAYNDLVALAKNLGSSSLITAFNADPVDMKRLTQEVASHALIYQRIDSLLSRPSAIPDPLKSWEENAIDRRELARALVARADVARHTMDLAGALHTNFNLLRLPQAFHGGIVVDFLVSLAIEGMGVHGIYQLVDQLDASRCQSAIDTLLDFDANREPANDVAFRDRQVDENAIGWMGHFLELLDELSGQNDLYTDAVLYIPLARSQASLRLLVTEFALRKYQLTHNTLPDRLDQLVPDILPEVPRDPFDPTSSPLRYTKTPDGYLLYSIGANGVDDGGVAPESILNDSNELRMWSYDKHGDLRIDYEFADEETEASADVPDAEEAASEALPDK